MTFRKKLSVGLLGLLALLSMGSTSSTQKIVVQQLLNGTGIINTNSSGTIAVPNATDTLTGKATTDTLTNKTIAAASNNITATSGQVAQFNSGTGNLEPATTTNTELGFVHGVTSGIQTQLNALSGATSQSNQISGVGLSVSVSSNTLIVALKQADGSTDCSGGTPCTFGIRGTTAGNGNYSVATITAAMSVTLGTTASIGNPSGAGATVNVYFISDTTSELCVSYGVLDEGSLQSATATPSTSATTLYCTNTHTNKPIRYVGTVTASWSNPNWSAITQVSLTPTRLPQKGYPGSVFAFAGTNCPPGSKDTDGSAISRTTFSTLFGQIGTTYGVGDGSTTYNIPNTHGIFLSGAGSQTLVATYTRTLGTTQGDLMQGHFHLDTGHNHTQNAHTHTITNANTTFENAAAGGTGASTGGAALFATPTLSSTTATNNSASANITGPSTDGANGTPRTGAETRPANVAVNWCIWTG